ncbi:curlin [uncultured Roseibium sp.]|uniref:curlin n=1 Tax=uncultured Roseibium sp. TaxID=1936171 RepID=UPI003217A469
MKTAIAKTLTAATIATFVSIGSAFAGGSFSINIAPTDADQATAMRAGLAMYSVFNGIKQGGGIKQNGFGNMAGVLQNGLGNNAVVHQQGNGHNGTIQQNGNNNSYGLFQFGQGTDAHIAQNGNGQTGATFQFGW